MEIYIQRLKIMSLLLASFFVTLVTSYWLGSQTQGQAYLDFDLYFYFKLALMLLLLVHLYSLTVASWNKWFQFVLLPAPVALGGAIPLFFVSPTYGIIFFALVYVILVYNSIYATRLKNLVVKFYPTFILRYLIKGLLLCFAVLAALFVLVNTDIESLDVATPIAEVADTQVQELVNKDPNIGLLYQSGFIPEPDISGSISAEINNFIAPYRQFFGPVIALLAFGLFQVLNTVVYFAFVATTDAVYYIAYKTGFVRKETIMVEKENITF